MDREALLDREDFKYVPIMHQGRHWAIVHKAKVLLYSGYAPVVIVALDREEAAALIQLLGIAVVLEEDICKYSNVGARGLISTDDCLFDSIRLHRQKLLDFDRPGKPRHLFVNSACAADNPQVIKYEAEEQERNERKEKERIERKNRYNLRSRDKRQ